jgi:SDR family mycofactocin-dependent oxidoreductase
MGRVDGKVALITGAARGMGRSHALRLAEEGADLILLDICRAVEGVAYPMSGEKDLAETAEQVRALGRGAVAASADVRDLDALHRIVSLGVAEFGHLDVAVANAGVVRAASWDSITPENWQLTLDVNLTGTWNTFRAAIPYLIEQGGGSLIAISSLSGLKGTPFVAPYTASKYGITGLCLSLANELASQSIRVNTVHPAGVPTGMADPSLRKLVDDAPGDLRPIFVNALPVDMIEAVDVSNAVLYLASDESRYITGLQLKVDAGSSIR